MKTKLSVLLVLIFTIYSNLSANNNQININTIIDNASKNNKQIVIFFHMTHCGYCKRMEQRTFKNQNIQSVLTNNFIFLDINIDDDQRVIFNNQNYSKKEFSYNFDIDLFPTVLFFDKDYDVIYTSRGYRDSAKFIKILKFIQTKSYKKIDFFDYDNEKIEKE